LHFERERNTWQIRYKTSHLLEKEGPWETRKDGTAKEGEEGEKKKTAKTSKKKQKKQKKQTKQTTQKNNSLANTWWTNIENCKVFSKRPQGMDEARIRRKRHEALTREQTLLEWDEFRSGAVTLRAVGPWWVAVLGGVGWCWVVLGGVGWCWVVLGGVGWCWVVLGNSVGWCWVTVLGGVG
jgi:hypothetical protein